MGSEFGVRPDTKPELRLDAVGVFWIVWGVVWTVVVIAGMSFLYVRREIPLLRIRGLPLSLAAVALMHFYWFAVQLGYVYGPLMPEVAEYFIMSVWFPFGIALFHASNSRFLYVARAQKKYVMNAIDSGWDPERPRIRRTMLARWRMLDYSYKMLLVVALGMGFQLFLTLFMFIISRKFHSSFGIPGTEVEGTYMEKKTEQGRGWEWWPSVLWQIFWAWIVAPVILWRARHLRDTQGWRTQTIACCIASLHASPMWLIALYVPGMAPVNNYFIPPQWIALSIMCIEIFTIFIPCWQVRKQQALCQETLDSIARWESRQKSATHCGKSLSSSTPSWMRKAESISSSGNGSILTMDALEHTLAKNPEPLQHFSALRDFSGENIAFLTRVREWRATYLVPASRPTTMVDEKKLETDSDVSTLSRECFEGALLIYMDFISSNSAEFQVNLSSQDFKNLQAVFEPAARVMYGDNASPDPATPFQEAPRALTSDSHHRIRYRGDIPDLFTDTVFDDSEMSIKYLVLTNTWPKFIKERRSFDAASSVEGARN
ncbi:Regulator of G protein signaling superfamily [Ophiocordyceps camponoti-floridani]|uniref:Regulator of G protein signaling superfamily n=1 Tax=Ophiocordyceps camponoti-floridani TaxID=2030778 RepID=A0A8H4Q338_9HYPO|nr:Regulator of G protein signaling superfamily [Ophiocordyceps camponoti-floridani]